MRFELVDVTPQEKLGHYLRTEVIPAVQVMYWEAVKDAAICAWLHANSDCIRSVFVAESAGRRNRAAFEVSG